MQRNTASNGRFHTDWLNMMYPRLRLASNLLRDDGAIFISIDENEITNLKKVCNEVFGEENYIGTFVWRKKDGGGQTKEYFVIEHEFIVAYRKSPQLIWINKREERCISSYNKIDTRGNFKITKLAKWGNTARREDRPSMYFSLKAPDGTETYPIAPDGNDGRWRVGRERMNELVANDLVHWEKKENRWIPYEKEYFSNQIKTIKLRSILYEVANTGDGSNVLTDLFGCKDIFQNPKPIELIKILLESISQENDIILDFFSGSGTTAHAVMQLNAEDGGNRQFIMVQLPELCDENTAAYQAGCKNICEIGKERIRRAGRKIREEAGLQSQNLDIGFRVLKLDSSNMEDVYYTPQEFGQQALFNENIKPDRSNEDLLFQVMLDLGIELSAKIEARQIAGKTVHFVDNNYLVACFDSNVNETTITEIAQQHPVYFVMRDASAVNDNVIDNFEQIFKHFSPDTTCKII